MKSTKIGKNTFQLTVNLESDVLFEGFWKIPHGVSINRYIIKGDKIELIDGVSGWDNVPENLYTLMKDAKVGPEEIDYLIINHMEPDHSGWIESFTKINPEVQILCSTKAKSLLESFYNHVDNITCVGDGDSLDLGKGHLLEFYDIPNIHWPDTMAELDKGTGILYTCDAYGSFGKITSSIYRDEITKEEEVMFDRETKRYYSNVLASFPQAVKKANDKFGGLPIEMIAPGHGLIWKEPQKIMDIYQGFADCQSKPKGNEITLIWGSMYGMTEKAVNHVIDRLKKEDIILNVHQVPQDDWGSILASVLSSKGIILAMPTYEYKMYPPMASILEELGKKRMSNKKALHFGSYGWSGGAKKELDEIIARNRMNWEFVDNIEFMGSPNDEDLTKINEGINQFLEIIKED